MEKDNRQELTKLLESAQLRKEAYFGIFRYGGGSDESYIKANKQGLELFAATMLQAAAQIEQSSAKDETIDITHYTEGWISEDSTTFVDCIEPVLEKVENTKSEEYKRTWLDKLVPIGCFSVLILALVSGVVGFVTILKWLLRLFNQSL